MRREELAAPEVHNLVLVSFLEPDGSLLAWALHVPSLVDLVGSALLVVCGQDVARRVVHKAHEALVVLELL